MSRFLPALAVFPALLILASLQAGSAAGESRLLALTASAVLLGLTALSTPRSGAPPLVALLVVATSWALAAGPARGATVMALLTAGLAAAAWSGLLRRPHPASIEGLLPLAVALQFLFRSDRLLDLQPRHVAELVLLPVVAALAVRVLARDRERRALLAAGLVTIVCRGWSPLGTALLVTLAAARTLADRKRPPLERGLAALALAGCALWGGLESAPSLLLCALVVTAQRLPARLLVTVVAAGAALLLPAGSGWEEIAGRLPVLPLLLPSLASVGRRRALPLLAALAVGLATLRLVPGESALALPLALAALELNSDGAAARLQRIWATLLVFTAAAAAAYPWVRQEPAEAALGLVGLRGDWVSALLLLALVGTAGLAGDRVGALADRILPWGALGLLILGALTAIPQAVRRPLEQPLLLDAAHPRVTLDVEPPARVSSLALDSYLSYSHRQPRGSPVAIVRLVGAEGTSREWVLRSGSETGEWAARRADLRRLPGAEAPPSWLSWVAEDGPYFGQRYRAEQQLEQPLMVSRLELERPAGLREKLSLAVVHLELRR